tara:strand:+ start:249 stop:446 length:198 start_codon:yes stop_codon:yes gene_type:complete
MTAFMLACYMNSVLQGAIYFKSVKDCTFYSENLSGQTFDTDMGTQEYNCMCKLVPSVNPDKVRVY